MATNTTNYNLEKPDLLDFYDINVFNNNADIIDRELYSKTNKAKTGRIILTPNLWSALSAPIGEYNYVCNFTLDGVKSTDILNGSVSLDTEETAQDCGFAQYSETSENTVTFYAKELASSNIIIDYNYIQGV